MNTATTATIVLLASCVSTIGCNSGVAIDGVTTVSSADGSATVNSLHTTWTFPQPYGAYGGLGARVLVAKDPGATVHKFWSSTFYLPDENGGADEGGYVGIQDGATRSDGSTGKIAIFSIWNATGATPAGAGSRCSTFGGEGVGYHCLLDYDWVAGRTYRLDVYPRDGWQAAIVDERTGSTTVIGSIHVPAGIGGMDGTIDDFTEDFSGGYANCDTPEEAAVFFAPLLSGAAGPAGVSTSHNSGTCSNFRDAASADLQYAVQESNTGNDGSTTASLPDECGAIDPGRALVVGTSVSSCSGGRYHLEMQGDGDLALYDGGTRIWHTGTTDGFIADMQGDGNLVVYDVSGRPVWASNTSNHPGAGLAVQTDGNVVIYDAGHPIWATGTNGL
jgi:hypothetical protein